MGGSKALEGGNSLAAKALCRGRRFFFFFFFGGGGVFGCFSFFQFVLCVFGDVFSGRFFLVQLVHLFLVDFVCF